VLCEIRPSPIGRLAPLEKQAREVFDREDEAEAPVRGAVLVRQALSQALDNESAGDEWPFRHEYSASGVCPDFG